MGTSEQRYKWMEWLRSITTGIFIVIVGFLLNNINGNIKDMETEAIRTQKLFEIDYTATDDALVKMFDGEYTDYKKEKKEELLKDYSFKKGDK